jgi:hypothetical protein
MSCQCPAGCTGCSCSTTKPPTTTPAAPQHFTFTNAKNEHSAFAFIQVTDKNNCEYRIIAYMRDYTPESIPSMQFPPYREMLPTDDKTNNKLFHGPLRGEKANFAASVKLYYCDRLLSEYITFSLRFLDFIYGTNPKTFPQETQNPLPRPFRLRFAIPTGSDPKDNGQLVGLAELSDGTTSTDPANKPLPGHVGLRVYCASVPLTNFSSTWPIKSANLRYVATLGKAPTLPKNC